MHCHEKGEEGRNSQLSKHQFLFNFIGSNLARQLAYPGLHIRRFLNTDGSVVDRVHGLTPRTDLRNEEYECFPLLNKLHKCVLCLRVIPGDIPLKLFEAAFNFLPVCLPVYTDGWARATTIICVEIAWLSRSSPGKKGKRVRLLV